MRFNSAGRCCSCHRSMSRPVIDSQTLHQVLLHLNHSSRTNSLSMGCMKTDGKPPQASVYCPLGDAVCAGVVLEALKASRESSRDCRAFVNSCRVSLHSLGSVESVSRCSELLPQKYLDFTRERRAELEIRPERASLQTGQVRRRSRKGGIEWCLADGRLPGFGGGGSPPRRIYVPIYICQMQPSIWLLQVFVTELKAQV